MKKNVASQFIGAQMVSATDGSAFTGAVTVYVTGDAGTQAAGSVGSGACTHEGNGFHTYAPAQAETNYDHIGFTFTGSGAVPATVQVYTSFPQTGDNYARLGAPAGASVSADVAAVKAVLPAALVGGRIDANVGAISSDSTAADNAEAFFDGTGYAGTNNVIPTVTTLTGHTPQTGDAYARLGAPAGASVSADLAQIRATQSVANSGTAQAGGTASITLASGASSTDGTYDPGMVRILSGTGAGQARMIIQYVGSTRVASVDRDWRVTPDNTSVYEVVAGANLISTNEGLATAGSGNTITLNALASASNNAYVGQTVVLRTGTGQDQSRVITGYVGATKVATVGQAWGTNPASGSGYIIWPTGRALVAAYDTGTAPLQPTVAGRTLDVSAGGEAGLDWANIGSPTTAVNLSGTNIDVDQVIASVSGAVGSVTGNVGGNVTGSVGSVATGGIAATSFAAGAIDASAIAANAIGASELATDAVVEISAAVWAESARTLTALDEDNTTLDLDATIRAAVGLASANLDTQIATLATAANLATVDGVVDAILDDTGTTGVVVASGSKSGYALSTAGLAAFFTSDSGETYADAVAGSVVAEIADNAGGSGLTAGAIADAVWDEAIAGHVGAGSTGEALSAAGGAGDPWITTLPGSYTSGQAGKIVGDYLDAAISSRAAASVLGAAVGASISADIAAVKAQTAAIETDTQDLQSRTPAALVSGRMDASVGAMAANVMTAAAAAADLTTELQSGLATASAVSTMQGNVTDILADTNELQGDWANGGRLDNILDARASQSSVDTVDGIVDAILVDTAEIGAAGAGLTAVASASNLATLTGYVDTEVAAIKAKTDNLPAAPAAVGDIPTAAAIADAVHDEVVEGTTTLRQSVRLANAALGGKASGLSTTNAIYRDLADTKDRIDATVDADGNRSAVTRDLT